MKVWTLKLRKKTDIIDGFRFCIDAIPEWFEQAIKSGDAHLYTMAMYGYPDDIRKRIVSIRVDSEKGLWVDAKFGDWIVRDVCGIIYPVTPDVFPLMFEIVEG